MGTSVTFYDVHQLYSIVCTGLSLGFITTERLFGKLCRVWIFYK